MQIITCVLSLAISIHALLLVHIIELSKNTTYDARKIKLNESTAGADASVEVSKLHNIKLLATIALAFIIMMKIFAYKINSLHACRNSKSG